MRQFLKNLEIQVNGESHSDFISCSVKGFPLGYVINPEAIGSLLHARNPQNSYNTKRQDSNKIEFVSGIKGKTLTGEVLEFKLANDDIKKNDYEKYRFRLGHADLVSYMLYGENYPYEGGGPFSGRITALVVVVGEICRQILNKMNFEFEIYSQISKTKDFEAKTIISFSDLKHNNTLCINDKDEEKLLGLLNNAVQEGDTLGCEIEFLVKNVQDNLGGMFTDSFESILSHALFSIPGIKGISFGKGDGFSTSKGSEVAEEIEVINNVIVSRTNYNGGINGGYLNTYQDLYFKLIVKPPMSFPKPVDTLKLNNGKFELFKEGTKGRHDVFIGNKVMYVVKAWINIILLDYYL